MLAEQGGADGITVHLREDRRHIQDRDIHVLKQMLRVKMNLEMAVADEITDIAVDVKPAQATLVPEKREEVTTEGGLDVIGQRDRVRDCINRLHDAGIVVSLFIDPEVSQVEASAELGVEAIELHTGGYADAETSEDQSRELERVLVASRATTQARLVLNMGHGLTYRNVRPIAEIENVHELNIGHSIVSHAVMVGFELQVQLPLRRRGSADSNAVARAVRLH